MSLAAWRSYRLPACALGFWPPLNQQHAEPGTVTGSNRSDGEGPSSINTPLELQRLVALLLQLQKKGHPTRVIASGCTKGCKRVAPRGNRARRTSGCSFG